MKGLLRLLLRASVASATMLLIICLMTITSALGVRRATRFIMQTAFRFNARMFGIRIRVKGALAPERPLMVVTNHFSYLDLFVLGSVMPAAFTPKTEIRSWPVIGFMCRVSGCLFIDRKPSRILENKDMLAASLAARDVVCLFPEGTTNEGMALLPFKSSLFELAIGTGMTLQPASIAYTHLNGKVVTAADYPTVGWYGESLFFPHLMHFLQQQSVEATLVFHPPIENINAFESRKALALHCQNVVANGIREAESEAGIKKAPLEESKGANPNNGG